MFLHQSASTNFVMQIINVIISSSKIHFWLGVYITKQRLLLQTGCYLPSPFQLFKVCSHAMFCYQ